MVYMSLCTRTSVWHDRQFISGSYEIYRKGPAPPPPLPKCSSNQYITGNCGRELMMKLNTGQGGKVRNWYDTTWWQSGTTEAADQEAKYNSYRNDIKTKRFDQPVGSQIEIVHLKGSTVVARSYYNVRSQYRRRSLKSLVSSGTNTRVATKNTLKSWGQIKGRYGEPNNDGNCRPRRGDLWVDNSYELVMRARNMFRSQDSWDRISALYTGCKGGHIYGGMGGTHKHGGWTIAYEAMPVVGYCNTWNGYGQEGHGWDNPRGGAHPYRNCGGSKRRDAIDIAIFGEPYGKSGACRCTTCSNINCRSGYARKGACAGLSNGYTCVKCNNVNCGGGKYRAGACGMQGPQLMMKLSTTAGGKVRNWYDTTWWEGTGTENANQNYKTYRNDIKTPLYSQPMGETLEIHHLVSGGRSTVAQAKYAIHSRWKGRSLRDVVRGVAGTNGNIGKKIQQVGSIKGRYHNGNDGNCRPRYGDLFADGDRDLIVRARNLYSSQDSWDRIATAYNGCKGGHIYGGLGGTHKHGGWTIAYEAMPVVGYCNTWNGYGSENSGYNHPRGGASPYKNCGGWKRRYPVDVAIMKGPAFNHYTCNTCDNQGCPAGQYRSGSCSGTNNGYKCNKCSNFECGKTQFRVGSCSGTTNGYRCVNCNAVNCGTNRYATGKCGSVGEHPMIKLSTSRGGAVRNWYDTNFWQSDRMYNEAAGAGNWKGYGNDIKSKSYIKPIGATLTMHHLKGSSIIATSIYEIKSQYRGKSLRDLVTSGSFNGHYIGKKLKEKSSGNIKNSYGDANNDGNCRPKKGDMFVDSTGDLRVRARNVFSSQDSWDRISARYDGCRGGHIYGGIGGTHKHGGWTIAYEAMPVVGYCNTWNGYGQENHGWNNPRGGAHPYRNCGGSKRRDSIDIVILGAPSSDRYSCSSCSNVNCRGGQYRSGSCGGTTNGYKCNTCSNQNCPANNYRSGSCRGTSNGMRCNTCRNINCGTNRYRVGSCGGTSNGFSCRSCSSINCKSGYYRSGSCSGTTNSFKCNRCSNINCGANQYRSGSCSGTSNGLKCNTCSNINCPSSAYIRRGSCSGTNNGFKCEYVPNVVCKSGEYRVGERPGKCNTCSNTNCAGGQFRTGSCSGTSNGYKCNSCSNQNCAGGQYRSGSCSGTTNGFTCNTCANINCASNNFRTGSCSSTTNGFKCNTCANINCADNNYRTGSCSGVTNAFKCNTCANINCASNNYRAGSCSGTTNAFSCKTCDNLSCSANQFQAGGCSGTTNGLACNTCANINCATNNYRLGSCSGRNNGFKCNTCKAITCASGWYRKGVCSGTTNGFSCAGCDNLNCANGKTYRTGTCTGTTNAFKCNTCSNMNCGKEGGNKYQVGSCTGTSNGFSCKTCDNIKCSDGKTFRVGGCSARTNGYSCKSCSYQSCKANEFQTGSCTGTTDGFKCNTCDNIKCTADNYRTGGCSARTNAFKCNTCDNIKCESWQERKGSCAGTSNGYSCPDFGGFCLNGDLITLKSRLENNHCGQCNSGFDLRKRGCSQFEGTCKNGDLIGANVRKQENHCGKCDSGFYLANRKCEPQALCNKAQFLKGADGNNKGSCATCPTGTWMTETNHRHAKCKEQDRCGKGQYFIVTADTTNFLSKGGCGACKTTISFQDKTQHREPTCQTQTTCGGGQKIVGADTSTKGTCSTCDKETYRLLSESAHRHTNCIDWTKCGLPSGGTHDSHSDTGSEYQTKDGSTTVNRVCASHTVCSQWQWQTAAAETHKDRTCESLSQCGQGERVFTKWTKTSDLKCGSCTSAEYMDLGKHRELKCKVQKQCIEGQYIISNLNSFGSCKTCGDDTYQDSKLHRVKKCKPHTKCGPAFFLKFMSITTPGKCLGCPKGTWREEEYHRFRLCKEQIRCSKGEFQKTTVPENYKTFGTCTKCAYKPDAIMFYMDQDKHRTKACIEQPWCGVDKKFVYTDAVRVMQERAKCIDCHKWFYQYLAKHRETDCIATTSPTSTQTSSQTSTQTTSPTTSLSSTATTSESSTATTSLSTTATTSESTTASTSASTSASSSVSSTLSSTATTTQSSSVSTTQSSSVSTTQSSTFTTTQSSSVSTTQSSSVSTSATTSQSSTQSSSVSTTQSSSVSSTLSSTATTTQSKTATSTQTTTATTSESTTATTSYTTTATTSKSSTQSSTATTSLTTSATTTQSASATTSVTTSATTSETTSATTSETTSATTSETTSATTSETTSQTTSQTSTQTTTVSTHSHWVTMVWEEDWDEVLMSMDDEFLFEQTVMNFYNATTVILSRGSIVAEMMFVKTHRAERVDTLLNTCDPAACVKFRQYTMCPHHQGMPDCNAEASTGLNPASPQMLGGYAVAFIIAVLVAFLLVSRKQRKARELEEEQDYYKSSFTNPVYSSGGFAPGGFGGFAPGGKGPALAIDDNHNDGDLYDDLDEIDQLRVLQMKNGGGTSGNGTVEDDMYDDAAFTLAVGHGRTEYVREVPQQGQGAFFSAEADDLDDDSEDEDEEGMYDDPGEWDNTKGQENFDDAEFLVEDDENYDDAAFAADNGEFTDSEASDDGYANDKFLSAAQADSDDSDAYVNPDEFNEDEGGYMDVKPNPDDEGNTRETSFTSIPAPRTKAELKAEKAAAKATAKNEKQAAKRAAKANKEKAKLERQAAKDIAAERTAELRAQGATPGDEMFGDAGDGYLAVDPNDNDSDDSDRNELEQYQRPGYDATENAVETDLAFTEQDLAFEGKTLKKQDTARMKAEKKAIKEMAQAAKAEAKAGRRASMSPLEGQAVVLNFDDAPTSAPMEFGTAGDDEYANVGDMDNVAMFARRNTTVVAESSDANLNGIVSVMGDGTDDYGEDDEDGDASFDEEDEAGAFDFDSDESGDI